MKNLIITLTIAIVYGLCAHFLFTVKGPGLEVMSISFLFLLPFVVGYLTTAILPFRLVRNYQRAFFLPWLPCLGLLVITLIFALEGAICWIMIYPIISCLAGIGGLIGFSFKHKDTRPNSLKISILTLLPILSGLVEKDLLISEQDYLISREILINSSSANVWHHLTHLNTIPQNPNKLSLTHVLGFPKHLSTHLDTVAIGGKRTAYFEKGLVFNETITQLSPERLLQLSVKTDPSKIAATVLDEHIVIGGKHVNIYEDTYQLSPVSAHSCKLTLSSKFRICTPFNWYAGIWSHFLMKDILNSELKMIARKAEQKI